jgi:predicted membrane channel-forming protein YqfA (hemolysin III family)
MSFPRLWLFIIVGALCIALAASGVILNLPSSWGLLEITLFMSLVTLGVIGILRLIYAKGLPD